MEIITAETKQRKAASLGLYFPTYEYSRPLEGLKMRLFNTYSFYDLGACLRALRALRVLRKEEAIEELTRARKLLASLQLESLVTLRTTHAQAEVLSMEVAGMIVDMLEGAEITEQQQADLSKMVDEFETILRSQMPYEYTYVIEQLAYFNMPILVAEGERLLTDKTLKVVSKDAVKDIKEAGRCLAFELPTAAGIHMMRAFEKVFRQYYEKLTGATAGHTDIYALMKILRDKQLGDPKLLTALDNTRNLYRNPLAHEVFLEIEEAIFISTIARDMIRFMGEEIAR